jgi:hypothetical protein
MFKIGSSFVCQVSILKQTDRGLDVICQAAAGRRHLNKVDPIAKSQTEYRYITSKAFNQKKKCR